MTTTNEITTKLNEIAIERLEILKKKGLMPCVLKDYKKEGLLYYSENLGLGGTLYWLTEGNDCPKEWLDKIKEIESDGEHKVYHATLSHTCFGDLLSLFVLTKEDIDNEEDFKRAFINGYAFTYTMNLNDELCSEYGDICYRVSGGGLIRVS